MNPEVSKDPAATAVREKVVQDVMAQKIIGEYNRMNSVILHGLGAIHNVDIQVQSQISIRKRTGLILPAGAGNGGSKDAT